MARHVVVGDLRVQQIERKDGRRSWTIVWPEGTVHTEADRFLRLQFEALVRKVLGVEAAVSIDWRRPRMVCIAAGFSHHDRVAVQRLPERMTWCATGSSRVVFWACCSSTPRPASRAPPRLGGAGSEQRQSTALRRRR
ncbi:hypothetical protein GCM10027162_26680 [Streptomyces incanus]